MERIKRIIFQKQSTVRSAALILMIMVLASRILGLVRDRMLAARFAPDELGVYFAAFRIPNFLFELLVMGALTSAFIPIFTKYIERGDDQEGWRMTISLINFCAIILAVFCIPMIIWMEPIARVLAPGFTQSEVTSMASFARFMIVFQVFPLLIGNFYTGILQSYRLFFLPALAPVVYNVGIIVGVIGLSSYVGLWGPVIGVAIGAFFFMIIQLPPLAKFGYRQSFVVNLKHQGVREVLKLMAPRTVGLAIAQIDSTVDLILSTLLGARMVTIFSFAQHLQQLPIGLFGATVAQAAFPLLSQATAKNNKEQFQKTLTTAINQMSFFILPVSVLFIVLRIPIVRLVFGASHFDWNATVLTGATLAMFSLSLIFQSVSQIVTRAFYASYDTKTPVYIGIVTIIVNSALSILFVYVYHFPIWSLGLSTSLASTVNVVLLFVFLYKKGLGVSVYHLVVAPMKMLFASCIMGAALYIPLKLFDQLVFDTTRTLGLLFLTGISGTIGILCYLFFVWVFDVTEVKSFIELVTRVKNPKMLFMEPANEVIGNGSQNTPIG